MVSDEKLVVNLIKGPLYKTLLNYGVGEDL